MNTTSRSPASNFAWSLLVALAVVSTLRAAEPAFAYNFFDLNPGTLEGQDGWKPFTAGQNPIASPVIIHSETEPKGQVGQTESGDKLQSRSWKYGDFGLSGAPEIAFEFDVRSEDGRYAVAMMGMGASRNKFASDIPAMAGVMFGVMAVRESGFQGEVHNAYGPDGKPFKPVVEEWYRVRTEWTFDSAASAWMANLSVKNISQKEEEYTPLWFDKQQTLATVPLGIKTPPEEDVFTVLALRVGTPFGKLASFQAFRLNP